MLNVPLFAGDVAKGRRSYVRECAGGHGRDGYVEKTRGIPQLAGQHSLYFERQIEEFAAGTRRHDSALDAAIFASFSPSDIADILAYLSTLDDD